MKVPRPSKLEEMYYSEFVRDGVPFAEIAQEFVEEDPEIVKQAVLKVALYKVYRAQICTKLFSEPGNIILLLPLTILASVLYNLVAWACRNGASVAQALIALLVFSPVLSTMFIPIWHGHQERRDDVERRKRILKDHTEDRYGSRGGERLRDFLRRFEENPKSLSVWGISRK